MGLLEEFDAFWKRKPYSLKIDNDSRSYQNFRKMLANCKDASNLDLMVEDARCNKETLRRIAVAFYDFLESKKGIKLDSSLREKRFFNYPFERQLEIAKFLQEPHTNGEIKKEFCIDYRTIRSDLQALRDGIEVLGTRVRVEETKTGGKKYYKSTVHPVFLPLNLTEAYALTKFMPELLEQRYKEKERLHVFEQDPNAELIRDIAEVIRAQLSDYAQKKLFPGECPRHEATLEYHDDEKLAKSKKGIMMYLLKSGKKCRFVYQGKDCCGVIRLQGGNYRIKLENGEELAADPDELEFLIDSVDYQ